MFVLGIDAGGSKTVCLLADGDGEVRRSARGPGANLAVLGELEVEKVLYELMEQVLTDEQSGPAAAICLGIAGVDRAEDAAVIRGILRRIGQKAPVLVVNDALIALEAGAGGGPGIVIIAGTGSIAYGRNEKGQATRAGGWGYVLADEGSGWWIGQRAIMAVMRQFDGRGPATSLTPRVLAHFGVAEPFQLVYEVYYRDTRRRLIASLSEAVQASADEGDPVAREIIGGAAGELVIGGALGRRAARDAGRAIPAGARGQHLSRPAGAEGGCDPARGRGRAAQPAAAARRGARAGRGAARSGRGAWRRAASRLHLIDSAQETSHRPCRYTSSPTTTPWPAPWLFA